MEKIIKGKRYNTDTAKKIYWWLDENLPQNDLSFYQEGLFRKKTGEYFLYGYGNARSKYAQSIGGNSWSGSEKITPLTEAEAREWMERHAPSDECEAAFTPGRIEAVKNLLIGKAGGTSGKNTQYYSIKLPVEMVRELGLSEDEKSVKLICEDGKIIIEKIS